VCSYFALFALVFIHRKSSGREHLSFVCDGLPLAIPMTGDSEETTKIFMWDIGRGNIGRDKIGDAHDSIARRGTRKKRRYALLFFTVRSILRRENDNQPKMTQNTTTC
jgi:hypothetical protein